MLAVGGVSFAAFIESDAEAYQVVHYNVALSASAELSITCMFGMIMRWPVFFGVVMLHCKILLTMNTFDYCCCRFVIDFLGSGASCSRGASIK